MSLCLRVSGSPCLRVSVSAFVDVLCVCMACVLYLRA